MRDADYIKASERYNCTEQLRELARSHAVADDVMRELADALREWLPCDCTWCAMPEYRGPCRTATDTKAALARYDRLTGDSDD
jgi:hypothetical protein